MGVVCFLAGASFLAGCGSGAGAGAGTTSPLSGVPGPTLHGVVYAGKQPVSGASVQVYAVGNSGYGSPSSSLLSIKTDASGTFTLTNYQCAASSTLIYLVAEGGNPGLSSGTNNPSLALMAALGTCGSPSSEAAISVNEVTTVASVWALAQFMSPGANVGASSANAQGLVNAFATVNNIVNVANGTAPGTALPAGAVAPTAELNALANILDSCASSNGDAGPCTQLFAAATPNGATAPTNTIDAALDIALNPGHNVSSLYILAPANPPFQSSLASAPEDWMVPINYTGGGLKGPSALAIDQASRVWVANYYQAVTELSPQGQALSPTTGFTGGGLNESYGLTIDNHGNVWVVNEQSPGSVNSGLGSVTELSSSGRILSGSDGFSGGGISFPVAVASDSAGNIWISNYGDSTATVLANSGTALSSSSGYGRGQLNFPVAVALDGNQNAWLANQSATTATNISFDGTQAKQFTCCNGPSGVAIDRHGNVWVANFYGDSVSEMSNAGVVISSGYNGGGIFRPQGIAVDGQGNIWIANYHGNSISELEGADSTSPGAPLSPPTGFGQAAGLSLPFAVAIDASGNLWVSSFASNTVTEYLGVAAPVKTPLLGPVEKP
jgi:hypothetical protein